MVKGSNEKRFNFVDVVIIIAIVAVIGAVIWIAMVQSGNIEREKVVNVEYTVRLTSVRSEFADSIHNGDMVIDSSTGEELGLVIAVRHPENTKYYNPNVIVGSGERMTVGTSSYEDLYDIHVTISSKATIGANGVAYVDKNKILIGAPINFRISPFAQTCYITAFAITELD